MNGAMDPAAGAPAATIQPEASLAVRLPYQDALDTRVAEPIFVVEIDYFQEEAQ